MVSRTRSRSPTYELRSRMSPTSSNSCVPAGTISASLNAGNLLESGAILGITSRTCETVTALAAVLGCWLLQPALLSTQTWRARRDCSGASEHSMDQVRHNRRVLGPMMQLRCSSAKTPTHPGDIGISPKTTNSTTKPGTKSSRRNFFAGISPPWGTRCFVNICANESLSA